jgi:nucleoid-associated protein YgaU
MKKSAPKSAIKPAAKAAAKPAAKAPAKAPAKKAASAAKQKAVAEPPATFISAQIDIGFGNHLALRGEGPGLSWDRGLVMDNVGQNLWTASVKGATQPVVFKVLVNDLTWNTGNDYVVEPGQSVTVHPSF